MKVFVISDIHTDYKENMEWVEAHCAATNHPDDAIIVAGDVSDDLATLRKTLRLLTSAYGHVFYTTGNHELWVRKGERGKHDSLGKLQLIQQLCAELGVHTTPTKLPNSTIWIVPIWSWYHAEWDQEPDVPNAMPIEKVMMDFHACDWSSEPTLKSSGNDSLARYFDALNDPQSSSSTVETINNERAVAVDQQQQPIVISFSHFLPHQDLLPEKRLLHYPNLAKACGSTYLADRVATLSPHVHVYGHTHFTGDQVLHGVRYVQWPLGYPRDQRHRRDGGAGWSPLVVWDSGNGGATPQQSAYWSNYYRVNERVPHDVSPAPWVVG